MSSYVFITVDPRHFALEGELNKLAGQPTLGVEVTVPALAEACSLGNIDPQHAGGDIFTSAIEAAVEWELPPSGVQLATVRPDADAFGAMAVLAMRKDGVAIDGDIARRVAAVGLDDRTASEWSPKMGELETVTVLQALKAVMFDHKRSVSERVELIRTYLETGDFVDREEVTAAVVRDRREYADVAAIVTTAAGGRIALVQSTSRFAVSAAYLVADVVVAINPAFRFAGGEPHRKVTVCQKRPGLVDLKAVFAALGETEPGWGGSPTIGGSPQGESSVIPTSDIVAAVERHLL